MNQKEWFTLYLEAKERHPGMILLVRDGEGYQMFGTDAESVADVCNLSVFSASHDRAAWAGFPADLLEGCLRKLIHAGHRVAICDQIEPLVNRIVAPGRDSVNDDEQRPRTAKDTGLHRQRGYLEANTLDVRLTVAARGERLLNSGKALPSAGRPGGFAARQRSPKT